MVVNFIYNNTKERSTKGLNTSGVDKKFLGFPFRVFYPGFHSGGIKKSRAENHDPHRRRGQKIPGFSKNSGVENRWRKQGRCSLRRGFLTPEFLKTPE